MKKVLLCFLMTTIMLCNSCNTTREQRLEVYSGVLKVVLKTAKVSGMIALDVYLDSKVADGTITESEAVAFKKLAQLALAKLKKKEINYDNKHE